MLSVEKNLKRKNEDDNIDGQSSQVPIKIQKNNDDQTEIIEILEPNLETTKPEQPKEKPMEESNVICVLEDSQNSVTDNGNSTIDDCIILDNAPKSENEVIDITDSQTDVITLVDNSDDDTQKPVAPATIPNNENVHDVLEIVDETLPSPEPNAWTQTETTKDTEKPEDTEIESKLDQDCMIKISFQSTKVLNSYVDDFVRFFNTFAEFDVSVSDLYITIFKSDKESDNTPKKKSKRKRVKKELFTVDLNPSANDANCKVAYSRKFSIEEEKPTEKNEKKPSLQTCFNCQEAHALKDCPIPKDFNRINTARQKFMSAKTKTTRYHCEEDQKYSHLKPGVLSENLRKALGLRQKDLPSYIYGMRAKGYPPGWLEEAKVTNSNLRMFNINGNKVKNNKTKKKGLDPDKVIEYPGYNIPPPRGAYDEFRKYNVPPFSNVMKKENMIKHYENTIFEQTDSENSDMDLDESMESDVILIEDTKEETALTLDDLEEKKKELLQELKEENVSLNDNEPARTVSVISSALGTPILKSTSPYERLPNPDNFTVGVSPVIDYENLPNATGGYEKMSGLITKIRNTLSKAEKGNS